MDSNEARNQTLHAFTTIPADTDLSEMTSSTTNQTIPSNSTLILANAPFTSSVSSIVYIIVGLFGFFANTYVITVIAVHKPMHKQVTNIYIANQSLLDGFVAVLLFFTTLYPYDGNRPYRAMNVSDELLCRVWYTQMPMWGLLDSSTYNIVALTFERYIAIVHPIWHKTKFSQNKLIIGLSIAFVWIIGPLYNASYMIQTGSISAAGVCTIFSYYWSAEVQTVIGVVTFVFEFFIPLLLILYGYLMIAFALHKRVKMTADAAAPNVSNTNNGKSLDLDDKTTGGVQGNSVVFIKEAKRNESMAKARTSVLRTSALVSFFFVFCWSWDEIYFLAYNLGNPCCNTTSAFGTFSTALVCINCCVNPVVCSLTYTQFKQGAALVFKRKKAAKIENSSTGP